MKACLRNPTCFLLFCVCVCVWSCLLLPRPVLHRHFSSPQNPDAARRLGIWIVRLRGRPDHRWPPPDPNSQAARREGAPPRGAWALPPWQPRAEIADVSPRPPSPPPPRVPCPPSSLQCQWSPPGPPCLQYLRGICAGPSLDRRRGPVRLGSDAIGPQEPGHCCSFQAWSPRPTSRRHAVLSGCAEAAWPSVLRRWVAFELPSDTDAHCCLPCFQPVGRRRRRDRESVKRACLRSDGSVILFSTAPSVFAQAIPPGCRHPYAQRFINKVPKFSFSSPPVLATSDTLGRERP